VGGGGGGVSVRVVSLSVYISFFWGTHPQSRPGLRCETESFLKIFLFIFTKGAQAADTFDVHPFFLDCWRNLTEHKATKTHDRIELVATSDVGGGWTHTFEGVGMSLMWLR